MKIAKLFFCSLTTSLLLISTYSIRAEEQSPNRWFKEIVGRYQSQIESGGSVIPGTTEFILTDKNSLIGSYELKEESSSALGVLSQCQEEQIRTIRCLWNDKYGSGELEVTFSEDFSSFNGYWKSKEINERFIWNGSR